MPSRISLTDWGAGLVAATILVGGLCIGPTPARADLYKYRDAEGGIVVTTEKRPNLELIEVLSGGGGSNAGAAGNQSSSSTDSSSSDSSDDEAVREAKRRRRQHRAENQNPEEQARESQQPRRDRFDDIIGEAAESYDVPFGFVKAVIRVESDFSPSAVSHAGAMGLMQLMPKTADYLNVTNPFDPRQNIFGGTKLLRLLIDRYDGDINLILSAYNAGDAAVDKYEGIPYRKTRQYVASVYRWYKYYNRENGTDEDAD